ncbi:MULTISPECIES: amidase family protein [unclassified Bacillus (in: firmicutes)]|uniref:amidase family protein n=1 Tax=unclassified Bacillus (in: firmicutes) TaxID=185979 RepID=UPI0023DB83D8|nr:MULTISPECIES: amidase family protein [unclassified Bacillus (in: firmicutes)]MCU0096772.1 amidase family protein [Bacillus sp. OR9]MCU4756886.1 amidase family protein [Bacillus cereus]HDR7435934.1 amidase [Bacillus anthracis]MDF2017442.1 amidase family protein [Bacillus sp. Cr_R3]MDF2030181.1 amidase family protein [Bacillus sp. Cr_R16]
MEMQFNALLQKELNIHDIQAAMEAGQLTSKELVMYYLHRIAMYDQVGPKINSILEINPDAIFMAEALDHERKTKGVRGPLHGIPVLLKDNIETNDSMHTSAGTIALEQHISSEDAFLVTKLREAGAVIIGKTNMTELANGMSFDMWAGYSARGGQTINPYGTGEDDMFVGGSSTGSAIAVAANFTVVSVGTETDGSILSPAVQNSVVGIKPTVGLISRRGIIPLTYSQDTAGPFARTVTDATILLGSLTGLDDKDVATHKSEGIAEDDYTKYLDDNGLNGAKIGVYSNAPKDYYESGEYDEKLFKETIEVLRSKGATVVEDIDIPSFHREWSWGVSLYELKHSLDNYLSKLPSTIPVHSISELMEFNKNIAERALKYGQTKLEIRKDFPNTLRNSEYLNARLEDIYFSQEQGIDFALEKYNLDAILFPSYIGSTICAKAGYPSIAIHAGYMESGRPFGITLASTAFSEGILIKLAYAYGQATKHRRIPNLS